MWLVAHIVQPWYKSHCGWLKWWCNIHMEYQWTIGRHTEGKLVSVFGWICCSFFFELSSYSCVCVFVGMVYCFKSALCTDAKHKSTYVCMHIVCVCVRIAFVLWHFTLFVCQITTRVRRCNVLFSIHLLFRCVKCFSWVYHVYARACALKMIKGMAKKKLCHSIWIVLENVRNVRCYQFQSFKM